MPQQAFQGLAFGVFGVWVLGFQSFRLQLSGLDVASRLIGHVSVLTTLLATTQDSPSSGLWHSDVGFKSVLSTVVVQLVPAVGTVVSYVIRP